VLQLVDKLATSLLRTRLVDKLCDFYVRTSETNLFSTFSHLGLAVDRLSRIFVADTGNHRVQVFDESGRFLFAFGRKGTDPGEFNEPCDVTIAHTGHVIVADRFNDRLQFFTPDGKFVRQMQCGVLRPIAVTTDQYNHIVIVDSDHSRVMVVTMGGER
jgi:DNA-binding beta-propeller fold protein YncE